MMNREQISGGNFSVYNKWTPYTHELVNITFTTAMQLIKGGHDSYLGRATVEMVLTLKHLCFSFFQGR